MVAACMALIMKIDKKKNLECPLECKFIKMLNATIKLKSPQISLRKRHLANSMPDSHKEYKSCKKLCKARGARKTNKFLD
jgi:hypothetical protein